ncbi:Glycerophosphodiester phosphodiesterase domain [Trinorchestia longiramus]|nr:Glycerophosphodiester phosphodiesterase domain [Trinorchestia longiramus]
MCIVGSCPELGSWNPHRIIPLEKVLNGLDESCTFSWNTETEDNQTSEGSEVLWSVSLQLPLQEVQYRYCIAVSARDESLSEPVFAIKSWETHFCPRIVPAKIEQNHAGDTISKFGVSLGQHKVEAGWLVYDSAVQLKLGISKNHADPIVFWRKRYKDRKVLVKVTPLELKTEGLLEDTTTDHGDSRAALATTAWPLVEVAVLKEDCCTFSRQDQFGLLFNAEDFTTFQCRLINPKSIAYLFDFYLDTSPGEIPRLIGRSHLLPSNLVNNFGVTTIPITSSQHSPIGQLTVHYMVVKPMPLGASDMSASFARYWKETWTGLEVGHRGAGNSYHSEPKSCATIRENTIASFKYAAEMGADMVETDVQLSKDLVPVIYHDFHACIALNRKKDQEAPDLLEIPIKDLTLAQLQALKVGQFLAVEARKNEAPQTIHLPRIDPAL